MRFLGVVPKGLFVPMIRKFSFFSRQAPPPTTYHGISRADEFTWIEGNVNFLHEQNEIVDRELDTPQIAKWSSSFAQELTRFYPAGQMPPELIGEYFYFSESASDGSESFFRRHRADDSQREELLNLKTLAQDHGGERDGYCHVGMLRISHSGRFLAYTVDLTGSEMYTAYIKDLESGRVVQQIENAVTIEWAEHQSQPMLVYTSGGLEFRASQVRLRGLGGSDSLLFDEIDPVFQVDVALSKDRTHLFIKTSSKTSSEVRVRPAFSACTPSRLIQARQPGVTYFLEHCQGRYVMVTNENAPNNKVLLSPIDHLQWSELVPHQKYTVIHEFDVFRDHLVLYERNRALPQLSVISLNSGARTLVALPQSIGELTPGVNSNFSANSVRFCFSNPVFPTTTLDYNFFTQQTSMVQADMFANLNSKDFVCECIFVPSGNLQSMEQGDADSDWVPLTVVRSRSVPLKPGPLLLQAYGAYGMNLNLAFDPQRYILLRQGWSLAFCHARGGGELGERWHRAGSLDRKVQTFADIIACADFLICKGFTQHSLLAGLGASAGGMALAAVSNSRPDLFKALVLKVPAVDLLGSMLDRTLAVTNLDTLEWGDPIASADAFKYMLTYSPYDNLCKSSLFPSVYITAGLKDSRVSWWEPAKYAAKIAKTFVTSQNPPLVLLRTNMDGGHAQDSVENIEAYAFLHHVLRL